MASPLPSLLQSLSLPPILRDAAPYPCSCSTRQIDSRQSLRSASFHCSVMVSEFWAGVVRVASSVVANSPN